MSSLRLRIDEARTWFRPGATIVAETSWHLDGDDEAAQLNLLWHTSGKGTQDVEVVESLDLVTSSPGARGSRACSVPVPAGPYSFSGKLITLAWAIELVALPSHEVERVDLVIGPEPSEIDVRVLREL